MSSPAFSCAPIGSVLVNVWARGASRSDVEALEAEILHLHGEVDEPVSILMIIPQGTGLPDEDARKLAGQMLRRAALDRVVIVIDGRGFWAGAMRSVFVGIGLIYKPGVEWTVKPTIADAVEWLAADLAVDTVEATVATLLERVGLAG